MLGLLQIVFAQHIAPEICVKVTEEHEAGDFSNGEVTNEDDRFLSPEEQLEFADTESVDLTTCEGVELISWAQLPISSSNH